MQKAEPQQRQTQHRPAQRPGGVQAESPQGEQIARLDALMQASPAIVAQRKLFDMIHSSPHQATQQKFFDGLHDSPAQEAQRKKIGSRFGAAQRVAAHAAPAQPERQAAAKPNNTGLPDNLKSGIEHLSGMSLDNVKVHYNSSQPAQLNALAYAQGTDIHVAPGQEQHLPHEAWHVVQQAQGRVQPTMQMKDGVAVNDDKSLEHEADVMGGKSLQMTPGQKARQAAPVSTGVVQRQWIDSHRDYYMWDKLISGVRWFCGVSKDDMFFIVEDPDKAKLPYLEFQGKHSSRSRGEWVALHGSDPLAEEDSSVTNTEERLFKRTGSGMDKVYYWNGGALGWLETKQSVKEREFKAWAALNELGVKTPLLLDERPPPAMLYSSSGEEVGKPGIGYWIEHVPMSKTLKPKMMVMEASSPFKKIVQFLEPESCKRLKASLILLKAKLGNVANIVGELTIAIHQYTGEIYLLDFSPNEMGQVGGEELAKTGSQGLDNMIKAIP